MMPVTSKLSPTVQRFALIPSDQIWLLPDVSENVACSWNVVGTPVTAAAAWVNWPISINTRPLATCAANLICCVALSVAVAFASAVSKCASAALYTSAFDRPADGGGVSVYGSGNGVPLQNHSARYVSAMPNTVYIWAMFDGGVGANCLSAAIASPELVRARYRSRRIGVRFTLFVCTDR